MERIEFTRAQRTLLAQLVGDWRHRAEMELNNGRTAPNPKRLDEAERTAMHLRSCADQLQAAIERGELPMHFGFQIMKTPHRGLT